MRGTTTIQSVSAKIEKLEAKIASYESKLTDAKAQLEEEKNNKNALIAKIITSQIGDLDETILQKILHDYSEQVNGKEETDTAEEKEAKEDAGTSATEKHEQNISNAQPASSQASTISSNINKEANVHDAPGQSVPKKSGDEDDVDEFKSEDENEEDEEDDNYKVVGSGSVWDN